MGPLRQGCRMGEGLREWFHHSYSPCRAEKCSHGPCSSFRTRAAQFLHPQILGFCIIKKREAWLPCEPMRVRWQDQELLALPARSASRGCRGAALHWARQVPRYLQGCSFGVTTKSMLGSMSTVACKSQSLHLS